MEWIRILIWVQRFPFHSYSPIHLFASSDILSAAGQNKNEINKKEYTVSHYVKYVLQMYSDVAIATIAYR